MKKNAFTLTLLFVFVLVSGITVSAETRQKPPLGTWHYDAPEAPYGYESGDLVLKKENNAYTGSLIFSDNYSVDLTDINIERKNLSFTAYVEGMEVSFEGTFTRKSIEGTITYSGTTLSLTATPKKKK